MAKEVKECYICGKKPSRITPWVKTGKPPKNLSLCSEHASQFFNTHNSWKNVKMTLTKIKKM